MLADLRESDELVALALDGEQFPFEPSRTDETLEVAELPGGWLFAPRDGDGERLIARCN